MIYEVTLRYFFKDKLDAEDFFNSCEKGFDSTISINEDDINPEYSGLDLIENRHDEEPQAGCRRIRRVGTAL